MLVASHMGQILSTMKTLLVRHMSERVDVGVRDIVGRENKGVAQCILKPTALGNLHTILTNGPVIIRRPDRLLNSKRLRERLTLRNWRAVDTDSIIPRFVACGFCCARGCDLLTLTFSPSSVSSLNKEFPNLHKLHFSAC